MDGFAPGVNGFYDVGDQLSRYLRDRAGEHFERQRAEKRAIDSREDFEARRERVREAFRDSVGGLPDRPDDLAVEVTDVHDRDGYSVELVTFESRPGFHVTANCYVPDGEGPHPGICFLCGHVAAAKADPQNQRACIELALNGFVVVIVDPLSQGERRQYDDPDASEAHVHSGVFGHSYAGQQCYYAGGNVARFMINDARCALDYLCDRPDVDESRIGVTGTSGGGTQTAYLALLDDRIAAAAPCCSLSTREAWLATGKSHDAEANLHAAISRGIDYDDLVTGMAPRPLCIGAAASDFFPIEGVREAYERAQRVYELYDAGENVHLTVTDGGHASVYEFGDAVLGWLCDRLGDGAYESHGDLSVVDEAALDCTPEGNVREAFPDERPIDDLIRAFVADRHPDAGPAPDVGDREVDAARVRAAVVETLDLDRPDCELNPRYVAHDEWEGLTVEHVFFPTERDPDVVCTGVLVSDSEAPDQTDSETNAAGRTPAVVCFEDGTEALPERRDEVASLAAEHGTVFVFDPRGVGAVRNREIPTWYAIEPNGYFDVYGTEYTLAYDALQLGTSLFGMRVADVCRAVEFLRAETGAERIGLVGEGIGAYHALYAAVADSRVDPVDLRDLGPSFHERATSRAYSLEPRLTVYDVIGVCDVPHVLAALADRDLSVRRDV